MEAMKTIPLFSHEIQNLPALRALWRPADHLNSQESIGREFIYRDGIVWASLKPGEVVGTHVEDFRSVFGGRAIFDGERAYTPIVVGGGDGKYLTCPFGNPCDVLVCEWFTHQGSVRHERRYRIASVAVRRVDSMRVEDAVNWGIIVTDDEYAPGLLVSRALKVWEQNWPGAAWVWVVGIELERRT